MLSAGIVILLGVSAFRKKKRESKKADKRVSSLRREFSAVKQKSINSNDDWIGKRLEDDFDKNEFVVAKRK